MARTTQNKTKLKTLDLSELKNLLQKKEEELVNYKMELKLGKLKNVHLVKTTRKEIARIKTFIRLKELTGEEKK